MGQLVLMAAGQEHERHENGEGNIQEAGKNGWERTRTRKGKFKTENIAFVHVFSVRNMWGGKRREKGKEM